MPQQRWLNGCMIDNFGCHKDVTLEGCYKDLIERWFKKGELNNSLHQITVIITVVIYDRRRITRTIKSAWP